MIAALYLTPYQKGTQKWTNDLNIRPKTIKLFEENVGINLCVHGFSKYFLNMTPKAQATKEKQLNIIKI